MKGNDTFEPPLSFILADKLSVRFRTPEEIGLWVNQEFKFYQTILPPAAQNDQMVGIVWSQINNWFNNFNQRRNSVLSNPKSTAQDFKNTIDELLAQYTSGNLVFSQSPIGMYVAQLASTNSHLAARVLVLLGNYNVQFQSTQNGNLWLRAGTISEALRNGWVDQKPIAQQGFETFRQEWEGRFQGIETNLQGKIAESKIAIGSIDEQRKSWEGRLSEYSAKNAETLKHVEDSTTEVINKAGSEIENFKKTYNAALALRAPTQYWKNKRRGHRFAAFGWLFAFALLAASGATGCWFVWHETVEKIGNAATYTSYLPTLGAAALAAWVLRICSRQALSNFSFSADAGERVAMVTTFLALLEGGHATENERGLILAAIFRPSAKITDDAAPPTWMDFISKDHK